MARRDYFPMFFRYRESFDGLSDEQVGRIVRAALDYAADGKLPRLQAVENMAFAFMRGDIDRAAKAYEERCEKNREAAQRRWGAEENGSPGSDANASERIQTLKTDANDAKQTINQSSNQSNNLPSGESTRARARGIEKPDRNRMTVGGPDASGGAPHRDEPVPPTYDDVCRYCDEAELRHIDRKRFFENYAASGWRRNGDVIRDWKALCRKWDAEDAEKAAQVPPADAEYHGSFDTDEFYQVALARSQRLMSEGK